MANREMVDSMAICDLLTTINEHDIGAGCVLYAWDPKRMCDTNWKTCIRKWLNEEVKK